MKSECHVFGRIVKKYKLSNKDIKSINTSYEKAKKNLKDYGHKLAGRLDSELDFKNLLTQTSAFNKISKCMRDYIDTCLQNNVYKVPIDGLNIVSCWVNDMKAGEYNPPHTHHDLTGWSTVLFLKVPEFINDANRPHKFMDGKLGFVYASALGTHYVTPQVGDFYIFEAAHQHMVLPFKVKKEGDIRRSMSFNFVKEKNEQVS